MKIVFHFIILLTLFSLQSCDDELELFPTDEIVTDIALQSPSDFNAALLGVYDGFRRSGYYGATSGAASIYFIPDVISDNVIISALGRRSRETFYDLRYAENFSTESFWLSAYTVIQRANLILENLDMLEAGEFRDNLEGECLALRAIAHFDMVKLYSSIPTQANPSDLGIPYVTSTDASLLPSRNSVSEVYDLILQDFTSALSLINEDNGTGRVDANVINAYLSRYYLYTGNYAAAVAAGQSVTPNMANLDEFFDVWKDNTDKDDVFKVVMLNEGGVTNSAENVDIGVAWLQESPNGIRSEYVVSKSLYDLYLDNDVRKTTYFETSAFSGITQNHIIKYRGRLTGNVNQVDAKVMRYAEVVLNIAEAAYRSGDEDLALQELNRLRSNRYINFTPGAESGEELLNAILLERRLELAFEGHRFFDLKRLDMPLQRDDFGDAADGTGEPAEFKTLEVGDYRWNMAIGEGEMDANPNMTQNPGY